MSVKVEAEAEAENELKAGAEEAGHNSRLTPSQSETACGTRRR